MIGHHTALIYVMVLASAADTDITDAEMRRISHMISNLPVFAGFEMENLRETASACIDLLQDEDGLDKAFDRIVTLLPRKLRETAYALACDVVAADGDARQEELRFLEMARHRLEIDRLIAAGIERGARARFARLQPADLAGE
ncbi:MAG: tellurite resistance TerB family protein [Rhodospirillales bacterium]|jgi:tellurite resistance protein|nr:tellurite resistance TerB family protein [Rhodospirillales bacterium]